MLPLQQARNRKSVIFHKRKHQNEKNLIKIRQKLNNNSQHWKPKKAKSDLAIGKFEGLVTILTSTWKLVNLLLTLTDITLQKNLKSFKKQV